MLDFFLVCFPHSTVSHWHFTCPAYFISTAPSWTAGDRRLSGRSWHSKKSGRFLPSFQQSSVSWWSELVAQVRTERENGNTLTFKVKRETKKIIQCMYSTKLSIIVLSRWHSPKRLCCFSVQPNDSSYSGIIYEQLKWHYFIRNGTRPKARWSAEPWGSWRRRTQGG